MDGGKVLYEANYADFFPLRPRGLSSQKTDVGHCNQYAFLQRVFKYHQGEQTNKQWSA